MATVRQTFYPNGAEYLATAFPALVKNNGTNSPVKSLAFDAAATETAFWDWTATAYGSGNVTCYVVWYADTASSGVVRWDAAIAAITPDVDTQDVETKAFATSTSFDDTHLGTTGQRLHIATIVITNLDSLAADDEVQLKLSRLGAHANDTMTGDALVTKVRLTYSDT
jgi:hypothetical protein